MILGMMGALLISGIAIYLHNRFFDIDFRSFRSFQGSAFVLVLVCVMIPVAFLAV